jgi:hypothetical protein
MNENSCLPHSVLPNSSRLAACLIAGAKFNTNVIGSHTHATQGSPSFGALATSLAAFPEPDLNAIHVAAAYRRLAQLQKTRYQQASLR